METSVAPGYTGCMAHHAYLLVNDAASGIAAARTFAADRLGLSGADHPDVTVFSYGLCSVADARRIAAFAAQAPVAGAHKCIIVYAGRLFHEAQNAFLKLFEEPAEGTTLILVVPAEGSVLPTLRSRLVRLDSATAPRVPTNPFFVLSAGEQEKYITKLIARTKSDKDTEKQEARLEAAALIADMTRAAYAAREKAAGAARDTLTTFLHDLAHFAPLMHTRSAPLKLIFEHMLLVMPPSLRK